MADPSRSIRQDDPVLPVDPIMADLRHRVREQLRRRLAHHGGVEEFDDLETFDRVEALLRRAIELPEEALLLPHMFEDTAAVKLETGLRWSSHRPTVGRFLIAVKRTLLLPIMRWLFDYTRSNFERQQRLNDTLLACVQTLAIEQARLRIEVDRLRGTTSGGQPGTAPSA